MVQCYHSNRLCNAISHWNNHVILRALQKAVCYYWQTIPCPKIKTKFKYSEVLNEPRWNPLLLQLNQTKTADVPLPFEITSTEEANVPLVCHNKGVQNISRSPVWVVSEVLGSFVVHQTSSPKPTYTKSTFPLNITFFINVCMQHSPVKDILETTDTLRTTSAKRCTLGHLHLISRTSGSNQNVEK